METVVVNLKRAPYDVYIGRPSKWGNPFSDPKMPREEKISLYREWIWKQPKLLRALDELRGKRLGCYCKPLPCHGDVLVEIINRTSPQKSE